MFHVSVEYCFELTRQNQNDFYFLFGRSVSFFKGFISYGIAYVYMTFPNKTLDFECNMFI